MKKQINNVDSEKYEFQEKYDQTQSILDTLTEELQKEVKVAKDCNVRLNHKLNEMEEIRLPIMVTKKDFFDVENWNNKFTAEQIDFIQDTVVDAFKKEELNDVGQHVISTMKARYGFKWAFNIRPAGYQ